MDSVSTSLASLVKEGVFGDVEFVKAVSNEPTDIGAQFASNLIFIDLIVKCKSGEQLLPLVIKLQNGAIGHYSHFYNELIMYQMVIPTLGFNEETSPKMYYGKVEENKPLENLLIFEDLRPKKFIVCKKPLFLDFAHISIALKKIAKFHSLSFILKHEDLEKFHELTGKFKKHDYSTLYVDFDKAHNVAAERGVKAFQEMNGSDEVLDDFLKAMKDTFNVWQELLSPEEPFGVLGHGDFCNNNVLFKYDNEEIPIDCALIDFQRGAYLSPGSELGFYLYMHTTAALREKHWDEFLEIYWETLKENIPEYIKIPSFEDFLLHFSRRVVYGYFIACFFLSFMLGPIDVPWNTFTLEQKIEHARTTGGKEADKKLADIVSHMYKKKYLHAYLESIKQKDGMK